ETGQRREAEARGKDADHGSRLSIDHDRFSEKRRFTAEALRPETMADEGESRRVWSVLSAPERAAQRGTNAENLEEIRRHRGLRDPLRVESVLSSERHAARANGGESLEPRRLAAKADHLRARDPRFRYAHPIEAVPEHYQPRRITIAEVCEQDAIGDGEYRCARCDTYRQGEYYDGGVAGRPCQRRQRISRIAHGAFDPGAAARLVPLLVI